MFDLSIWRCSPALKEEAERVAAAENRNPERVAEERKNRNYADFWVGCRLKVAGLVLVPHNHAITSLHGNCGPWSNTVNIHSSRHLQRPISLTEPFRVILSEMRDRLYVTREVLHQCLIDPKASVRGSLEEAGGYVDVEDFFKPLALM